MTPDDSAITRKITPVPGEVEGVLAAGAEVQKYVILGQVGKGAMGVVYSAWDQRLARRIALKFLTRTASAAGEARFYDEARAMAQLSHANVISVFEVGRWQNRLFIAMEFVEGMTLRAWLSTPRTWREIVDLFLQVGEGLAAAHQAGIVHRDLKPDNVLIDERGHASVGDFGVAGSTLQSDPEPQPQATPLGGTPSYMAPEHLRQQRADERSDQFAFCVALYEALVGHRPWSGASLEALITNVETQPATVPRAARVPAFVVKVLLRGLQPKAEDRFESMRALLKALRHDPGLNRRRLALAAMLSVALGLVLYDGVQKRRALECRGAPDQLADAWSPTSADAIRSSFLATQVSYAADTSTLVTDRLSEYAGQWSRAHVAACEATRRGEQSPALLDLRMICLDRRRQELKGLAASLMRADASLIERATAAVDGLVPIASCAQTAEMASVAPLPADAHKRAEIELLGRRLSAGAALQLTGQYAQMRELALDVVAQATALGYRPLEAEAQCALADAETGLANMSAAAKAGRACSLAAAAGGVDRLVAIAEARNIGATAVQNQLDEAMAHADAARASIERLGQPPELLALLESNLAAIFWRSGRYDQALAELERADAHYQQTPDRTPRQRVLVLKNAASLLAQAGRSQEAMVKGQEAVKLAVAAVGPQHPLVGTASHGLACAQLEADRAQEAYLSEQKSLELLENALGPKNIRLCPPLLTMSEILRELGRTQEGVAFAERGLAVEVENLGKEHPDVAISRRVLGSMYTSVGRFAEAEVELNDAIVLLERTLKATHPEAIEASLNLSELAAARHRFPQALELANRALKGLDAAHDARDGALRKRVLLARGEAQLGSAPQSAIIDLERALELDHQFPNTAQFRAQVQGALAVALKKNKSSDSQRISALATSAYPLLVGRDPDRAKALEALIR